MANTAIASAFIFRGCSHRPLKAKQEGCSQSSQLSARKVRSTVNLLLLLEYHPLPKSNHHMPQQISQHEITLAKEKKNMTKIEEEKNYSYE